MPESPPAVEAAFRLDGRRAVVTGAASGIGRRAAEIFARAGADVCLADRDEEGLASAEASLRAECPQRAVTSLAGDLSGKRGADDLAAYAEREIGPVDVWANVAGILRYWSLLDADEASVQQMVAVNLLGPYWGTSAAGRLMREHRRGSIINISSSGGEVAAPTLSGYGMCKAGVIQLSRTAAAELGQFGIRVNTVAPGWIDTPMVEHYWHDDASGEVDLAARDRVIADRARPSPLGITGTADDIALCMLYLASDASRFVTGQVLRPNGGVFMA